MSRRLTGALVTIGLALLSAPLLTTIGLRLTHQRPLPTNLVIEVVVPGAIFLAAGLYGLISDGQSHQRERMFARQMDGFAQKATGLISVGIHIGTAQEHRRLEAIHGPLRDPAPEPDAGQRAAGEEAPPPDASVHLIDQYQRRRPRPRHDPDR